MQLFYNGCEKQQASSQSVGTFHLPEVWKIVLEVAVLVIGCAEQRVILLLVWFCRLTVGDCPFVVVQVVGTPPAFCRRL